MNVARQFLVGSAAGIVSGAVVLGLGGRLAMAGLVLVRGARPEFSAGGSLEVVLVGAFFGAIGGALSAVLARLAPNAGPAVRGALVGLAVFGIAGAGSDAARGPAAGLGPLLLPVLGAAALLCIVFGVAAERLRERWEARWR